MTQSYKKGRSITAFARVRTRPGLPDEPRRCRAIQSHRTHAAADARNAAALAKMGEPGPAAEGTGARPLRAARACPRAVRVSPRNARVCADVRARREKMVKVYCLYIFSRKGVCLFYKDYGRPAPPKPAKLAQEFKLMFGFLFSLKQLVQKMSPKKGGFYACSTSAYRLHYFESAWGLRFVLTTDLAATDMREALRHIYSQIYVECLTKNPLYTPGEPITCSLFTQTLERYVSSL